MRSASRTKLTYSDFLLFPDDGRRHELIDGEHYVTPSPATVHQRLTRDLLIALGTYCRRSGVGEVFAAPYDVVLSTTDVVEPDLLMVSSDQSSIVTDKHVRGAPALIVEILSPGTRRRDQGVKMRAYERHGVQEYWLVDPDRRGIDVRRLTGSGTLAAAAELSAGAGVVLTSLLLPGFSLPLLDLFP